MIGSKERFHSSLQL
ncbi:Protein of unknown function [Bacillus mycoides]|nr:Protein of unknown function [Bacillus mycoides]